MEGCLRPVGGPGRERRLWREAGHHPVRSACGRTQGAEMDVFRRRSQCLSGKPVTLQLACLTRVRLPKLPGKVVRG